MAIAFRAIATAFENGSSTIVCNVPTGTQDNDGMLLSVTLRNNYTVTTPSGWTLVGSALSGTASESCRKYVYSRVASSEPASYTITCSSVSEVVAEMVSYSGTATTGLVDASLGTTAYDTTTSLTADAITTTVANTMIVAFSAADMNGQTGFSVTPPSGMTERAETASTGTRKHLCTTSDVAQASAGTTGAKSATLSSTPLIVYKACFLVALAPAASASTAPVKLAHYRRRRAA